MSVESSLQDNWPILSGFVVGVLAWGKTVTTVGFLLRDVKTLNERQDIVEKDINEIKVSIGKIETHLEQLVNNDR